MSIEKLKLASYSLFLDASPSPPLFPPLPCSRSKMPFGQWIVATYIHNIYKGCLVSRGERGCISQRRPQMSDNYMTLQKGPFYCTSYTRVIFYACRMERYLYKYRIYGTISICGQPWDFGAKWGIWLKLRYWYFLIPTRLWSMQKF